MKKTKIINRLHDQKTKLDEFVIIIYLIYIYIYILYTYVINQEASIKCWWLVSSSFFICQYQGSTNNNDGFWVITNTTNCHRYETTPLIRNFPSRSSGILWFSLNSISIHFYIVYPMVSLAIFAASNPWYVCCWRSSKDLSWHGRKIPFPSQQLANLNYQVHFITLHKRCEHINKYIYIYICENKELKHGKTW